MVVMSTGGGRESCWTRNANVSVDCRALRRRVGMCWNLSIWFSWSSWISRGSEFFVRKSGVSVRMVGRDSRAVLWVVQSSGSRSGSGSQTGEVARPKGRGAEAAENPSGSNDGTGCSDGSDNGSSRLNAQGGSDNGSGNQVSDCTGCRVAWAGN